MSDETTRLRALLRESTGLALRLSERAERAEARVAELEAILAAVCKATDDIPQHLGATWWGQRLRAALVPPAEVSRG